MSNIIQMEEKHVKESVFVSRLHELLKETDVPYWVVLGLVQSVMHDFTDIALGPLEK